MTMEHSPVKAEIIDAQNGIIQYPRLDPVFIASLPPGTHTFPIEPLITPDGLTIELPDLVIIVEPGVAFIPSNRAVFHQAMLVEEIGDPPANE